VRFSKNDFLDKRNNNNRNAGVLPDQIFCDGWSIGYDERFPQQRRVQQALMFARFSEHDNLYAHPLVNLIFISLQFPKKE
jgi:Cu2+-containing amine oxidase